MSLGSKAYEVVVTLPAKDDLHRALDYIAHVLQNPQAAGQLVRDMNRTLASLQTFPNRFSRVRDELYAGVRWTQVKNYLVFYEVHEADHTVFVLRVASARQDWKRLLGEPNNGFPSRS